MTRYEWVASRKAEGFPTRLACVVAGVTRQGFYAWRQRGRDLSVENHAEVELVAHIRRIHADSGGAYGSPRVCVQLHRQGVRVNHKRVERLMRINGICGIYKRRKPRFGQAATQRSAPGDLVRRDFGVGGADNIWVGDITYINTAQGWLHLAAVLDLGSRRLIGYSMANHMRAELVCDALHTAAATRGHHTAGVVFHSDRGSQYLSGDFTDALKQHQMRHSVARVANCSENSVAESFFATLKRELTSQTRFTTRTQARQAIFAWIGHYNNHRLHSSLNYQTPTESQNQQQKLTQAA